MPLAFCMVPGSLAVAVRIIVGLLYDSCMVSFWRFEVGFWVSCRKVILVVLRLLARSFMEKIISFSAVMFWKNDSLPMSAMTVCGLVVPLLPVQIADRFFVSVPAEVS